MIIIYFISGKSYKVQKFTQIVIKVSFHHRRGQCFRLRSLDFLFDIRFVSVDQMVHLFSGFIGLPFGQLNSLAKSSVFDTEPITLKRFGLWESPSKFSSVVSGVATSHQAWK